MKNITRIYVAPVRETACAVNVKEAINCLDIIGVKGSSGPLSLFYFITFKHFAEENFALGFPYSLFYVRNT